MSDKDDAPLGEEDEVEQVFEIELDEQSTTKEAVDEQASESDEEVKEKVSPTKEEEDGDGDLGQRAQKRIRNLVAQKKELTDKLRQAEIDRAELLKTSQTAQVVALTAHEENLKSKKGEILGRIKRAKEEGDIDKEVDAQSDLAQVASEISLVDQYKQRMPAEKKEDTPTPLVQERPQVSPAAQAWGKRNKWFLGQEQQDRVMTAAAWQIHQDLINEGITPASDEDEYYSELDNRLHTSFRGYFKKDKNSDKVGGGRPSSGSGTPSSSKRKITLTPSEISMARRLGVPLQDYAKQKALMQR